MLEQIIRNIEINYSGTVFIRTRHYISVSIMW